MQFRYGQGDYSFFRYISAAALFAALNVTELSTEQREVVFYLHERIERKTEIKCCNFHRPRFNFLL